ncbi:ATP-binding protein [uncultured Algimonas sp.]|uniref:ATP-binding protein n=1 Tax=uncultured Algimonas sp. TaxID=1547920 RepID=UPI0026286B76|nr:ATP-binding protein [uncultured Algimonas sp.]
MTFIDDASADRTIARRPGRPTLRELSAAAPHGDDWVVKAWRILRYRMLDHAFLPLQHRPAAASATLLTGIDAADAPMRNAAGTAPDDPSGKPWDSLKDVFTGRLMLTYAAVISAMVATCVVVLGAFYYMQFRELVTRNDVAVRQIVLAQLEDFEMGRGYGLAAAAQRIAVPPLLQGDMDRFETGLKGLIERQDMTLLRIMNATGEPLFEGGSGLGLEKLHGLERTGVVDIRLDGDMLIGTGPLVHDGRSMGDFVFARRMGEVDAASAKIDAAFDRALHDNQRRILTAIVLAGLLALLGGMIAAIRIARRLSRPIRQLANAAGHISREEFGHELVIDRNDEIGDLFDAFNAMSRSLQAGREAQLKASEAEIARLEAENASQAKSQFLANMSHEIRTPMNGVLGMAQILSDSGLNASQKQQVDIILRSGEALMTVIDDILDISKLQSGQLRLDPQPFHLRDLVRDVAALLEHSAQDKGLNLIIDVPGDVPTHLIGDQGRIRQILINLIGNGLKFTESGHVKLSVRRVQTEVGLDPSDVDLRFDVEDTGIGIPAQKLDRIFNQFEQADNTMTRRFGGTGLGLSISRQLAETMGGTIGVTSQLGQGSTFTFAVRLPLSNDKESAKPAGLPRLTRKTPILVAAATRADRDRLMEQLGHMGASPVCVPDGTAAIALMRQAQARHGFRFPLVISDNAMPGMDGPDLLRHVRAIPEIADTPFMILSAVAVETMTTDDKPCGVVDVIEEPWDAARLRDAVMAHLAETWLALPGPDATTERRAAA